MHNYQRQLVSYIFPHEQSNAIRHWTFETEIEKHRRVLQVRRKDIIDIQIRA